MKTHLTPDKIWNRVYKTLYPNGINYDQNNKKRAEREGERRVKLFDKLWMEEYRKIPAQVGPWTAGTKQLPTNKGWYWLHGAPLLDTSCPTETDFVYVGNVKSFHGLVDALEVEYEEIFWMGPFYPTKCPKGPSRAAMLSM